MATLLRDLRYGLRMLMKNPGFTAVAVVTLALGIGANTTIFTIMDAVFLRPWPVKDSDQLARIMSLTPQGQSTSFSYADYLDLCHQTTAFSGILAFSRQGRFLKVGEELELIPVDVVSENYFSVLGVNAAIGRTFLKADSEPTAVISYDLWQRRFGADPTLVGKQIQLNNRGVTVVGIAPRRFRGLERFVPTHVWLPVKDGATRQELQERDVRGYELIGRLRPEIPVKQARAELDTISRRLAEAYPATNRERRFTVIPESERIRRVLPLALSFIAIASLVLLIACANVAGLLLARAETRRREMAIRLALGARRRHLVGQVLTESAVLALVGAAVGLLLTSWLFELQPVVMPPSAVPLGPDLRIDGRVLIFTVGVTVLAVLLFGLAPALQASNVNLVPVLKGEERGIYRGTKRVSTLNLLVIGQIVLSTVMLIAAGLLLRSFLFSQRIHPGFDVKKNLLILNIAPSVDGPERLRTLYQMLAERIEGLPGVKQATYARRMLLSGSGGGAARRVSIPGVDLPAGQQSLLIKFNAVGSNYFQVVGTRILRGRDFNRSDLATGSKVVLINETMARRFWPNGDCLGKRLQVEGSEYEIVGVVEDAKINHIHEAPEPYLYFAFAQMPSGEGALIVETAGDPRTLVEAIKQQVRVEDQNIAFLEVLTLKQLMHYALWDDQIAAGLVGTLSVVGMFLAAVGLYGVVSYAANRRTHEIGVRMALGASRSDVLKLIVRQGLRLAIIGVPIGLGVALGVMRLISSMLYSVQPTDPLTFTSSALLMLTVVVLASYFPARRAAKVDPMAALRYE